MLQFFAALSTFKHLI